MYVFEWARVEVASPPSYHSLAAAISQLGLQHLSYHQTWGVVVGAGTRLVEETPPALMAGKPSPTF